MMVLPSINVLVTDNEADEQLSNFLLEPSCLKIRFAGPDANVNDDLQNIEQLVGHELHPLVLDFYKIALSVYIADLQKKKKSKTYCRTISILIAVSDTGKWNSLKQKLEGTLRFLSGDNFKFYFVKSEKQTAPFKFEERDKRVVSLFSGGLDSLAGAKWLFDQKLEPVLVAHGGRNNMLKVQSALVDKLGQIAGKKLLFGQISARARLGKKLYSKEYSEPCRSFLYLNLGLVFALELGIKKLFVFENGTLALNVPISQSRIYLNTRTTHPVFMEDYKKFGVFHLWSANFN
jgi:hypothetical protein